MMKISFYVLAIIARTLAEDGEVACCQPDSFMSFKKDKAVCYKRNNNETTPTSINCEFGFRPFHYTTFIFKDGRVRIEKIETMEVDIDVTDRYCVHNHKIGIVCLLPKDVEINAYIMIVSVVFLILTVIIYSSLSELRDLYGKSFINLCGSLAIGLSFFVSITLMDYEADYDDKNLCAAKGFLAYFFLLVSFFWTTAISTQLLLNIRSPVALDRGWKTFGWYALFAWGCPAVITICMAIVNFYPGDHAKPRIGFDSCWFDDVENLQHWYWLYSVLAILMSVNIIMFGYVSIFFCRNNFASSHASTLKYKVCVPMTANQRWTRNIFCMFLPNNRFGLTLKLLVVMGLFWVIEIIATIDERKLLIWNIMNVVTCLQGLWIFLAWVVFRKRVIKAMYTRGWLPCFTNLIEKHLANNDEVDDNIIDHTSVPMNDH